MTIQEINKKNIWEIIRPITELQKNTQELYSQCKEDLDTLRKTILNASSQIKFNEEEHRYFYNGEECMPVSNVCHKFQKETDFDLVAQNYVKKNNILEPWQKVKLKWNLKALVSTSQGTHNHAFCEDLLNICNNNLSKLQLEKFCLQRGSDEKDYYIPLSSKQIAGYKYFEYSLSQKEIPFLAEIKLVLGDLKISGTFDKLAYSLKDKGLIMRDYKTNITLYSDFPKYLLKPFDKYIDQPLNIYTLQQNAYSLMLRRLGIKVIKKELVWLKENETFEIIQLENIEEQLEDALYNLMNI